MYGTCTYTDTCTRRSRAHYERGDRDRAIARSTVTRAYIGSEVLPAPRPSRAPLRISRSRYGQTEPTLSHSIALGGSPLRFSFLRLSARPTGQPAGWARSLWITCPGPPPRARFKILRQPKNRVHARQRHKTPRNSVKKRSERRLFRETCKLMLM